MIYLLHCQYIFKSNHHKIKKISQKALKTLRDERGQIVMEYILLLLVSVVIAGILLKLTDISGGPIVGWWKKALEFIGADLST